METVDQKQEFENIGFVKVHDLVSDAELVELRSIYDDFLANKYDLTGMRGDLSGDKSEGKKVEKITQIMRPSLVLPQLLETQTYQKICQLAKNWMGDDMDIDFDMMINKAPGTAAETPWHQDAAYWPDMPDKRALSFWIALDDADEENGCMMYVAESHKKPMLPHSQPTPNAALQCKIHPDDEISMGIIPAGSCIAHHGYTLHGALGNTSSSRQRRALIINLRPAAMISYIRSLGYDHLGTREVKNEKGLMEEK
jgi:phytanoyl-CoA hydroxylase